MSSKIEIYPEPGKEFVVDNGRTIKVCKDISEVRSYLAQILWDGIEPALKKRKSITIKAD